MAEVSVPVAPPRVEAVSTRAAERFLSLPRCAALAFVTLFALTFDDGFVHDDGVGYFTFLRRLFGADQAGVAYQFGSAFWNAPFYLASQLVAARGELDRFHAGEIGVNVASNVAMILCLYLGWLILRELELPRGPAVLLLTLFGTPLFACTRMTSSRPSRWKSFCAVGMSKTDIVAPPIETPGSFTTPTTRNCLTGPRVWMPIVSPTL